MLNSGSTGSAIFWGPPGCGKTTLARLLAKKTDAVFKELSATSNGIADVRSIFEEAKGTLALTRKRTILFLDEVHRFNKAQQDIFLPYLEQGYIQLIGATTENPSFKLTGALLSRCRVFVLERLSDEEIGEVVNKAIKRLNKSRRRVDVFETLVSTQPEISQSQSSSQSSAALTAMSEDSAGSTFPQLTQKILSSLVSLAAGDARTALSLLELVLVAPEDSDQEELLSSLRNSVSTSYDRTGESHYDMISALHKSVRGSQGSAAMYWLARMLAGGEDPMYIVRRMIVCASEDIGLADNHALPLAIATMQACQTVGMPECRINLAHLVAYLSEAPKSTRAYEALKRAEAAAKVDLTAPVPMQMRNAPTGLMKDLGYGRDYDYNPDYAHPVHNEYMPPRFKSNVFLRKEGDLTGKTWDEDALSLWEQEENGGVEWVGRSDTGL
ncbi:P-loop containing nucleoside triphosphate hydrolase protein [Athelia psychrophila]|uniref:P-loop containing nucleoside triphosphate hydrolase protein n=1 Tax=Athelia psychrophila TaxID=1759441 RepID=A0A166XAJ0_9AGAM|nr:P-loop containing nucleoside triphosphate hydrolase protein [Fibularhizoctonia sp. CBS 109695]